MSQGLSLWEWRALDFGYLQGFEAGHSDEAMTRRKPRMRDTSWRTVGYYLGWQDGLELRKTHNAKPMPKRVDLIKRAFEFRAEFEADPEKFVKKFAGQSW